MYDNSVKDSVLCACAVPVYHLITWTALVPELACSCNQGKARYATERGLQVYEICFNCAGKIWI